MLGRASNGKLLLSVMVSVPFAVEVRKMMPSTSQPQCWICSQPCHLEDCKIDEEGHAVHDECYAVKLAPEKGSQSPESQTLPNAHRHLTPVLR